MHLRLVCTFICALAIVELQTIDADGHGGCECLNVTWSKEVLDARGFHSTYGTSCQAWEDGDSTKHGVGTNPDCHTMWPDRVVGDWCCRPWCYVNRTTCSDAMPSPLNTEQEANLFHSYQGACGENGTEPTDAKWNDGTCPWGECECTGVGWDAETISEVKFSIEYGTYCAAWEDGHCGVMNKTTGQHTCGENAQCDTMWSKNDVTKDLASGDWCCLPWCYVAAGCPLADVAPSRLIGENRASNLTYSYDGCRREDPPTHYDVDEGECPYLASHDARPGGWQCACVGETFAEAELDKQGFTSDYGKTCKAWEDGNCNASAPGGHTCGTYTTCPTMWPSEEKGDWCCKPWCFVDKACPLSDTEESRLNAVLDGAFYASYAACDYEVENDLADEPQYTDDTCPFEIDVAANPCACLQTTYDQDLLSDKGFPRDYGTYCAAWDDGDASRHSVGAKTTCHDMWPELAVGDWCCRAWCYVDASCPDAVPARANDDNSEALYISYARACGEGGQDAETAFDDGTCAWGECECTGEGWSDDVLGPAGFPSEYGQYCAAWEDGNCGARDDATGRHECGAAAECDDMWWNNSATGQLPSGAWCCRPWCYVSDACPLNVMPSRLNTPNTSQPRHYSYDNCQRADTTTLYTPTLKPNGTCPFDPMHDDRPGGWRCACVADAVSEAALTGIGFAGGYGGACSAWEDGDCGSHGCGEWTDCRTMWPAEDKGAWCCQPWCFVDPALCPLADVAPSRLNALLGTTVSVSYQACDLPAVDAAVRYKTAGECPWVFDFEASPCECIQKAWDGETTAGAGFMRDYGSECVAWEDGDATRHPVGDNPDCHRMWPDTEVGGWCCAPWCYVNPDTCLDALPSWLNEDANEPLYYSYAGACGPAGPTESAMTTETEFTSGTCPWSDCTCTGDTWTAAALEEVGFPRQYGRWCAAWEDGDCTAFAVTDANDGTHPCGSAYECPLMWAQNPLTLNRPSGDWCCEPWCYVGPNCPLPKNETWLKAGDASSTLIYSYDTCRRTSRPVLYTTGDEGTCPFDEASDAAGSNDPAGDETFVHQVVLTLRLPFDSLDDFSPDRRLRFRRAVAQAADTLLARVRILSVALFSDDRRAAAPAARLLLANGVDVETSVAAESEDAAKQLADSQRLSVAALNRALADNGLPAADLVGDPDARSPSDGEFSGGAIAGVVLGIIAGILALGAFIYFGFMRRTPDLPPTRDLPAAPAANKVDVVNVVPDPLPLAPPQPEPQPELSAAAPSVQPVMMPYPPEMMAPMQGNMPMMGSVPPMGTFGSVPPMTMPPFQGSMPPFQGSMPPMAGTYPPAMPGNMPMGM